MDAWYSTTITAIQTITLVGNGFWHYSDPHSWIHACMSMLSVFWFRSVYRLIYEMLNHALYHLRCLHEFGALQMCRSIMDDAVSIQRDRRIKCQFTSQWERRNCCCSHKTLSSLIKIFLSFTMKIIFTIRINRVEKDKVQGDSFCHSFPTADKVTILFMFSTFRGCIDFFSYAIRMNMHWRASSHLSD